jgi:two-component sensor histidine kinase
VLDPAVGKRLGLVANELVTNAYRHGEAPIVVRLAGGPETSLSVENGGFGSSDTPAVGLRLVRQLVEHGLAGRFELRPRSGGGIHAEVVFPTVTP